MHAKNDRMSCVKSGFRGIKEAVVILVNELISLNGNMLPGTSFVSYVVPISVSFLILSTG